MEIIIGSTQPVGPPVLKGIGTNTGMIEAKVLNIRPSRKRQRQLQHGTIERRKKKITSDPSGGRVLVLLIPDGYKLPKGIESGNYRVFLRFVLQRK
ncbi:MAG: hypothetical protein JW786_01850 [Desulfobacterales bacterium]|nr:hypothetical protein [Desulfobacterales bacterium]